MYQNRTNPGKNRLYVTMKGKLELPEIKTACSDALQKARSIKSGFDTISDISEFIPATEECRLVMQETMKTLKEMGMARVVRIVPASAAVAANQWQRTSRAAGYTADQAPTLEEAEKMLDAH